MLNISLLTFENPCDFSSTLNLNFFCLCIYSFGMRSDEKRGVGFSGYGRIEGNRVYGGQLGALRRIIEFSSFSADTWRLALPLTSSFVAASGASAAVAPVLVAVTVGLVLRPASRVLRPALPLAPAAAVYQFTGVDKNSNRIWHNLHISELLRPDGPNALNTMYKCVFVCVPDFPFIFRIFPSFQAILRTFLRDPISVPLSEKSKTARVSYRLIYPVI